jgi:geranylgeranyl pyrophosphate synthase
MSTTATSLTFAEALLRYSDLVDEEMDRLIRRETPVPNLHDALLYSLGLDVPDRATRGKRLRPVLCLVTAEALGADPRAALPFAAAIELMHNFALVHDDIEDGDEARRGRPSTWVKYGVPHAVNAGDYLVCKVVSTLVDEGPWDPALRLRLLRLMSETLDHTHVGQCLDMNWRMKRPITVDQYLAIVREKTGFYLASPMLGGAMVAGAPDSVHATLRAVGDHLGPMFQIVDDMIDLTEGKGRSAPGSDIREGKRSYLVAAVTGTATPEELERLYDILDAPRSETTDADVQWVSDLFRRREAFARAKEFCAELLAQARLALDSAPPPLRAVLTEAADMLAGRTR